MQFQNLSYKDNNSFEERKEKFQIYQQKHPTKIPLIIERHPKCTLKLLDRPEVLIDETQKGTKLLQILQEKLQENSKNCSIFIFYTNTNTQFPLESQMKEAAQNHKDEDGFLYLTYNNQETLG
ncbi:unnamed protein product [Paramecium pentaurelia]|uniref:Autophagy-related protein n=1 Tax=Paramecium pentaurelia TaxID=43138 RepID=A0A8S1W9L1_9CILI|nr:unnamed protein product [Paramecium pentaurelia]